MPRRLKPLIKNCQYCAVQFDSWSTSGRFCHKHRRDRCRKEGFTPQVKVCPICNGEFTTEKMHPNKSFCTKKCYRLHYYKEHPEEWSAYRKKYRNKPGIKQKELAYKKTPAQYAKAYARKQLPKYKAKAKEWKAKNQIKIKAQRNASRKIRYKEDHVWAERQRRYKRSERQAALSMELKRNARKMLKDGYIKEVLRINNWPTKELTKDELSIIIELKRLEIKGKRLIKQLL